MQDKSEQFMLELSDDVGSNYDGSDDDVIDLVDGDEMALPGTGWNKDEVLEVPTCEPRVCVKLHIGNIAWDCWDWVSITQITFNGFFDAQDKYMHKLWKKISRLKADAAPKTEIIIHNHKKEKQDQSCGNTCCDVLPTQQWFSVALT